MFWNAIISAYLLSLLIINRKHEMFWNDFKLNVLINGGVINRKHEMFWNRVMELEKIAGSILTVNI